MTSISMLGMSLKSRGIIGAGTTNKLQQTMQSFTSVSMSGNSLSSTSLLHKSYEANLDMAIADLCHSDGLLFGLGESKQF